MTTNDNKPIKAYKGFNQDMTCRGFQYEEGKEYEHSGPVEACASGFHACENPIDCLEYYRPGQSVFHFVELSGETSRDSNGSKVAASHIKIGARLDIAGICKATFDYVRSKCTNENNAEPGKAATAGNHGAATAGYRGAATARGSAETGNNGLSVARGNDVKVKGGIGAVLVIAEENQYDYNIKDWKATIVDGKHVKADTWYKLVNGEFVEAE